MRASCVAVWGSACPGGNSLYLIFGRWLGLSSLPNCLIDACRQEGLIDSLLECVGQSVDQVLVGINLTTCY
jgi:hypothetical protein